MTIPGCVKRWGGRLHSGTIFVFLHASTADSKRENCVGALVVVGSPNVQNLFGSQDSVEI